MKQATFLFLFIVIISIRVSAQNVGIGTNNPSAKLHTIGSVKFDTLSGEGTRVVFADAQGNLLSNKNVLLGQGTNATAGSIPDNFCLGITREITLSGLPSLVPSFAINVKVNIQHNFVSDLLIYLIAPDGSVLNLWYGNGSGSSHLTNTVFTDAGTALSQGSSPFSGGYLPAGNLSPWGCAESPVTPTVSNFATINSGFINPNGIWKLRVIDKSQSDAGTFINWSVIIDSNSSQRNSNNFGYNSAAGGLYSATLGANNNASGPMSLSIGSSTMATGGISSALGAFTIASGGSATSMGRYTQASGYSSIAMGDSTTASGEVATAFGYRTNASARFSFASGTETAASALASTAMGRGTAASGSYSVAMGSMTTAIGIASFASGGATSATAGYATAMGSSTTASGSSSTALGYGTTASGNSSSALGYSTEAAGLAATAMGRLTNATGDYSSAFGYNTTASGNYSTSGGYAALAFGDYAVAIGRSVFATGQNSTAFGYSATASGDNSTAIGRSVSTAGYTGAFILGDNQSTLLNNTANNQMMMRFSGGYRIFTNAGATTGTSLAAGGNSWATISDYRKKENYLPAIGFDFLSKISSMQLGSWNYIGQDKNTYRHYGPMAQEFYKHFGNDGIGTIGNDTTIASADIDGVMMIAIQALVKENEILKSQNEKLEARLQRLEAILINKK